MIVENQAFLILMGLAFIWYTKIKIRKEVTMNTAFLKKLIECPSPSGDEAAIQKIWANEVKPFTHQISSDAAGNVYAIINPDASFKVLLAGHIDEIAFMVKHIDDKGYIYVVEAGGISPKVALGNRVRILGNERLYGVIGVKAQHKGGAKDDVKAEDLFIDVGATSKKELEGKVAIGDYIIYDVDYTELLNERISGRALDNRTGAFIVYEVMKRLFEEDIAVGVYGVSTVNEETTMGGAYFAASKIMPDIAIALDVTFATDEVNSSHVKEGDVKLEGGPVISIGSQINKRINALILKAAAAHDIPLQVELTPRATGTDADRMRFTGLGVPVALISLPLRYMHSPSEVVSLKDIAFEIDLVVAFIKSLKGDENLSPVIL